MITGKQVANTLVIILGTVASIGLYGALREAEWEPISSFAVCITYGVGFHHILTTFMKGVFK